MTIRRDILIRNRVIVRLYFRGITLKQIPRHLEWQPTMSYEAVKKVIQKCVTQRTAQKKRK